MPKPTCSGAWLRVAMSFLLLLAACATSRDPDFLSTAQYSVEVRHYRDVIPRPAAIGGALERLGDRILLVTGDGAFYLIASPEGAAEIDLRRLPIQVPINRDEFLAVHSDEWEGLRFRSSDVLLRVRGDTLSTFVSHHHWKASERCYVTRVSTRDDLLEAFLAGTPQGSWRTLFETTPCLSLLERRGHSFGGQHQGGRMAWSKDGRLLLTVGDHEFDGWNSEEIFAQDPDVSYGKILTIDARSGAASVLTLGHRNPQGLYVDPAGAIWSTEHGPSGGDELNHIVAGSNYGWPRVTYGAEYGRRVWPMTNQQGRHEGYVVPVYAWVPSIGVSNLTGVETDRFPAWKGDLLVASMVTETLYRLRLREGRVVVAEPLFIGERVRDLVETEDGAIVLWTDKAGLVVLAPASESASTDGARLFGEQCSSCHPAAAGASHGIGPDLWKISGAKLAAGESFAYSAALRALGGRWTDERLDAFLADPVGFAPGTAMQVEGISQREEREAIVRYLGTLR